MGPSTFLAFVVLLVVCVVNAKRPDTSVPLPNDLRQKHAEGYCAMYDICGKRTDGKILNCPYGSPSVKPDKLLGEKIQSLCPTITGNVCCSEMQFDTLRSQVQQVIPFLVGCPACLRNFLNLFCEFTCSPNQSQFINVAAVSKVGNNLTVDGIDCYVTDEFGEGFYESCKEVKFGSMNSRAIEFIGAGAKDFTEWAAFLGRKAEPDMPGSPYPISFSSAHNASGMKPLNVSIYSCGDSSLGCSCGDCPSSPACSSYARPAPPKKGSCTVKIGSLKAECIEIAVAILYIILVSIFLGWGFMHKKRKRSLMSGTKPMIDVPDSGIVPLVNSKKDDKNQGFKDVSSRVQLSVVQGYMSNFYRRYGTWVARNPVLVLCLSVSIVFVLCIGLIRFKVETRPDKLWVANGSIAAEEKKFFDHHLAPFYRIQQLIVSTIPESKGGKASPILTEGNIKLLFDIQKKVDAMRVNYAGKMVSLADICFKPLGEECATQSLLQYFKMDAANFDELGGVEHAEYCFQHFSTAQDCASAYKAPLDPTTALGGFSGNKYSEATAFIVTYLVNNAIDAEGDDIQRALSWEKAFIKLAKDEISPMVQSNNLRLAFSSESSVEEELKRESTADVITILISYIVMFAYISLALCDISHSSPIYISSKVLLALSGIVLVMLSVVGSIGFFSAIGVKSTLIIMEVIPFLVLAVGVDNMCILVHAVKRQQLDLPIEVRISNALEEVGPSITLASLCEVLAFAVGSVIPMPACRIFSMFAALAVLLDFILQVTAFVALIVFDSWRTEAKRIDCFPCIKTSRKNADLDKGSHQNKIGLLSRYMKDIHAPILNIWGVKLVVILVFVALALASIILCTRIEPGLEQRIVLPKDSYLQDYFNSLQDYLRIGPPLYFVVKNYNYSSESRQTNQLCSISQCDSDSLLNEIARASLVPETSYIAKPAASWLDDFLIWLSPEAFGCCRKFTNGTFCPPDDQPPCCEKGGGPCGLSKTCKDCTTCFLHSDLQNDRPSTAQFKEKLPWFLNALPSAACAKGGNGAYTSNVELKGYEDGIIKASAFRTYHTPLNKQDDFVSSLRAARDFSKRMSESLKIEVFPYAVYYLFFEQYLEIWKTALINLAIAVAAVFIVCLVITGSFWTSAVILLILSMTIVDLMGAMAILGIQLNAISVVNLVMAIGIAVEFCVHLTHAFLVSSGDRNQRMQEALTTMGASVFSGITLTKLLGVLVLSFSKTEIFVVYYFKMYLALVLLGFLHGLVFLPVFLSLFGPPSKCVPIEKREDRPSTS